MAGTYEPVFRAQGGGSTTPIPGGDAGAFGSSVGEGIDQAATALDDRRIADRNAEKRAEQETQSAEAGARMAKIGAAIEGQVQDLRAAPKPGGEGHAAAVQSAISDLEPSMFDGITDDHVRNAYREQWSEMASRISSREYGWEIGRRVQHETDNLTEQSDVLGATLAARAPDVDAWSQALDQVRVNWENVAHDPEVRDRGIREGQRAVTMAYARGLVRTDHAAFTAQIGTLSQFGHLKPEEVDQLQREAETEQRRDDAATRAAAALARSQAEQRYNLYHTRQAAGEELSAAELADYQAAATASAVPANLYNAQQGAIRQGVNRETQPWTAGDWETHINQLAALPHRTPAQDIELDQLRTIRSARITELNADPAGAAARNGNLAPTIADVDHVTPAERNARTIWARGYAQAQGLAATPYLDANDMRHYREQLDTGGDGAILHVAQSLRNNWGVATGTEIARQFGDHSAELSLMVGLNDNVLRLYGNGRQALERNRDLFKQDDARDIFLEIQDAIPPQYRDAVFRASRNVVAGMLDVAGEGSFDGDIYRMALHRSMGALINAGGMTGGIGTVNGAHIWLPPQISQAEADRRITAATPAQWVAAAVDERGRTTGRAPHYVGADGRPGRTLNSDEIARQRFATLSPGVYTIPGAVDAQGRPWRFDLRLLAPPLWSRR